MKQSISQTLLLVGVGAGLGYLAAVGQFDAPRSALACSEPRSTSPHASATTEGKSCSSERATRSDLLAATTAVLPGSTAAAQGGKKPNIVIIWGDDIGQSNISAYPMGLMGYRTPNIDRIAKEGMMFTDYYAEQSCTAGRASFITGQHGLRTGMTKVGLPGSPLGLQKEDPTIAELLKPHGYATGQFGKNHLGDRNEYLPTVHGFDEFYGNLYHLNAEEEPELPDYPKDPAFRQKYGPRGVLDCKATEWTTHRRPRFGKVGKQTHQGHRPAHEEADGDDRRRHRRSGRRLHRAAGQGRQAVLPLGELHPHALPDARQAREPRPVRSVAERVPRRDDRPRQERRHGARRARRLGLADNTFVMYSTDNGPHMNSWPDGGMTPFRNEKNSNWEGAYRVPCMVRWPGKIKPGTVSNQIVAHLDWLPTPGHGRRCRRQGEAAQGPRDRRDDLQGSPRRRTTWSPT